MTRVAVMGECMIELSHLDDRTLALDYAGDVYNIGRGEALSIREMTEAMVVRHGLDRKRVFVTGLSAGGAMASVMLATYPDVYAGGAIIAGLPFGADPDPLGSALAADVRAVKVR